MALAISTFFIISATPDKYLKFKVLKLKTKNEWIRFYEVQIGLDQQDLQDKTETNQIILIPSHQFALEIDEK